MKKDIALQTPHSIDAEQAVIGALLIDNLAWDKVCDKVSGKDFYLLEHRILFATIADLLNANRPVDALILREALKDDGDLKDIGGEGYIYQIMRNTPTSANVQHYAKMVRDKAVKRNMISAASEIIEYSTSDTGKTSREIVDDAICVMAEIGDNGWQHEIKEAKSVIGKVLADVDSRVGRGGVIGLSTGFADIDKMTHGLRGGDLIILAGRPSTGKTLLAINIAENTSIKNNGVSLIFSLEMSAEQLIERSLSSIARVDAGKLKTGVFTQDDCNKMSASLPAFNNSKFFIDDRAALAIADIKAACRKIKKDHGLSLVVVDYITLMDGDGESETIRVGNISRGLKMLARDLDVPVIAISQLNRGVEHRNDKRPTMADLRSSGSIEQDADLILLLYRDEVYYPDTPNKSIAELIISKNRNGEVGMINLFFNKNFCRFDSFTGKYVRYNPDDNRQKRQETNFEY
jgi:replicative DNA helicase